MIPYTLLLLVPLLFSFVMFYRQDGKTIAAIGGCRKVTSNSCVLPVFFFGLTVVLSIRSVNIGTDIANYKYYFNRISNLEFQNLDRIDMEYLFVLLTWLISRITSEYQLYLAIIAVLTVLPTARFYSEDREHSFLKIVLFMNMSNFVLLFSGLRQSIAIGVGILAYKYVRKKQPLRFLLMTAVACGFHHSAFMISLLYPLYYAKFKKKHLWYVIPSIILVFVLNRPIFSIAVGVLSLISSDKYTMSMSSTGAYTMLMLFAAFAVFSYVIPDEKAMDQETLGMRNFLLAAVVLQGFAPIHTLAMRMNYYFIAFIPVLIPKILKNAKKFPNNVVRMIKICFIAFFSAYYLYTTYVSCKTGISALDTYPFVPFWK